MLKPASRELTAFYLCISAGGAVGGAFVGLLAPALFSGFFELNFAIAAGLVLSLRFLFGYRSAAFLLACGVTAVIALGVVGALDRGVTTFRGRNFYGVVSIREHMDDRGNRTRSLVHGRVIHGGQKLDGPNRLEPTFYYGRESGVGIAIQRHVPHHRVGVVGLGAGTLATYGGFGEYYRFYEINPMVAELASSKFTFLHDSKARVELVIGDARLSLEREPDEHFDTLVLDAFSGDSIPMHLLTYEAFKCYFRHLNQDGVIAVHVSNRFLDLRPVAADIAARFHRTAVLVQSAAKPGQDISLAEWILITTHRPLLAQLEAQKRGNPIRPTGHRLWTDQFSNILEVLR